MEFMLRFLRNLIKISREVSRKKKHTVTKRHARLVCINRNDGTSIKRTAKGLGMSINKIFDISGYDKQTAQFIPFSSSSFCTHLPMIVQNSSL